MNRAIACAVFTAATVALLSHSHAVFADPSASVGFSKLGGRIIRSLDVAPRNPDLILVGNKGNDSGDGAVFVSRDGGVSWRYLNGDKPLAPQATDVQAVKRVSSEVILAGTWKHGLYRSVDAGARFERVAPFPSVDVRGIAQLRSGRLFAATGDRGILKSDDAGATWSSTGLATGFFWSVTANAEGTLLASSPASGVHRSVDGGESWTLLLAQEGAYHAESRGRLLAVAGEAGLQVSDDGGVQWRSVAALAGKRLSSVAFARFNDTVTVGGWVEGLWTYDIALDQLHVRQAGLPVVHVRETDRGTVAGSWGRGLHLYPASPETPLLITATLAGDAAVVEALLRSGAEPDVFDRVRNTPLIFASRDGHLDIAQLLIEHGADVNWIDGERATPLILAAHKNHPAVAKLLLEHGADRSTVDDFGETARSYAARRGTDDPILGWLR